MTFVTTQPEMLAAAAGQLPGIGTAITAQNRGHRGADNRRDPRCR